MESSDLFSSEDKSMIRQKLVNRLNREGLLQIEVSTERSQLANKEIAVSRFFYLLEQALKKEKKRIATKVPKSQVLNRLDRKKKQAQKKQYRKKNFGAD